MSDDEKIALIWHLAPRDQLTKLFIEFCRLKGYSAPATPIDAAIDKATGIRDELLEEFRAFVLEYVSPALLS
ncbi:MAG: hypothetical protein AAFW75_27120 [Cyanobacteria bacterium J06636_16]